MLSINSPSYEKNSYSDLLDPQQKKECCQSIIPDHIFEHLYHHHENEKVRDRALRHLLHIRKVHRKRGAPREHEIEKGAKKVSETATIKIYNAKNNKKLPGTEWKNTSLHHWDQAAKNAHDGLQTTYDFFLNELGRHSIDNQGMPLAATVHYDKNYDNAYWTGSSKKSKGQMVFGDGDGKIFNNFTNDLDVTAHELAHGVTEYTAGNAFGHATGLNYTPDEPGGLNEAHSDFAGSVVRQYSLKQKAPDADWLIGKDIFKITEGVRALRDMKNPGTAYDNPVIGKDLQVPDVPALQQFIAENGKKVDPHIGSGPANRAFALAAIDLNEESWKRAYPVVYQALASLKPDATYLDCAKQQIAIAKEKYPNDPKVEEAFVKAWRAVGVMK